MVKEGDYMRTKDIERDLGISKYALRYYEREGLIYPSKDNNGYRNYSEQDIQVLHLIKFFRSLDISIDDIKGILKGEMSFQECLKMNKMYLDKEIKRLQELQRKVIDYQEKDIPLIPAFNEIETIVEKRGLGFRKSSRIITLGNRATKWTAIRKWISAFIVSLILNIIWLSYIDVSVEIIGYKIVLMFFPVFLIHVLLYGLNIQLSLVDHSLHQFVEFLNDGIRYYKRRGIIDHNLYLYALMFNREDRFLQYCYYDDIEKVRLDVTKRYVRIGTPISSEMYIIDFTFYFKDGETFYFYWPLVLDNDIQYIAIILEEKVKNIEDKDHVIHALKNNIPLAQYMKNK